MIDAITAQISVSQVVGVLAAAAAIAITFVFMWWGVRKVTKMVMGSDRDSVLSAPGFSFRTSGTVCRHGITEYHCVRWHDHSCESGIFYI